MFFISPTYGKISLHELTDKIQNFIKEDPKAKYKVVIGTDSQTTNRSTIFVTALIIHRIGKGAQFYYKKLRFKPILQLHNRIYKETDLSLQLIEILKKRGIINLLTEWPLEIHLDIGQQGETRQLIQEVVGWVTSVGYVAKIKPNSYGASSVADKFTY